MFPKTYIWDSQIQTLVHVFVIQPISFLAMAILILRYITLSYCIALRTVSFRLKKRFPTIDHLVHAGVMRQVFNIIFKLHCFFDENQDCCYYLEISKLQMSVFKLEHFNQQEIIILIIINIAKGTTDPRHWVFRGRWIFGRIPNGLWPPPHFWKIMLQFFYNCYGCIYARRHWPDSINQYQLI